MHTENFMWIHLKRYLRDKYAVNFRIQNTYWCEIHFYEYIKIDYSILKDIIENNKYFSDRKILVKC